MKSIEVKFNEVCSALTKAGQYDEFQEKVGSGMPIEAKLNLAESILNENPAKKLETFKEQQYQAALASGMSEAEAKQMASFCGQGR